MIITSLFSNKFIEICNNLNPNWQNGSYSINANSSASASYSMVQTLSDRNGSILDGNFVKLSNFGDIPRRMFLELNEASLINRIDFFFENKECIRVVSSWDQSVQDEFESYLPKSKKGKIRAWYLPALIEEGNFTVSKEEITLPKPSVVLTYHENLSVDHYFRELNKVVFYPEDELWDGAYYWIKKINDEFSAGCSLYLFSSLEDKKNGSSAEEVEVRLNITPEMKLLYNAIEIYYLKENPKAIFDSIYIEVKRDGEYQVNYEYQNEEVYPNAPPMPEEITASYLLENLRNCLAYNAPSDYEWIWEYLKKSKTDDGKTQIEGRFFYSMNEDKSEPQSIEPGEYMFMYTVSERLFDEFLEDSRGWSEIFLYFNKNGKVQYEVMAR